MVRHKIEVYCNTEQNRGPFLDSFPGQTFGGMADDFQFGFHASVIFFRGWGWGVKI